MGVKICEEDHGIIKYDYHFSHYINSFKKTYALSDSELATYLSGNVIPASLEKGHYLLKYKDINVDIAKCDGRNIKNNLPKGLRVNIKN